MLIADDCDSGIAIANIHFYFKMLICFVLICCLGWLQDMEVTT